MWLLLVGTGFNAIARVEGGVSYQAFVYPGIVVMAALFGAMLMAISTVYDREFGMLRLMLASPAGVPAVLTGRAVAAAIVGFTPGGGRAGAGTAFCAGLGPQPGGGRGRARARIDREQRLGAAGGGSASISGELRGRDQRGALPAALRERGALPDQRYAAASFGFLRGSIR